MLRSTFTCPALLLVLLSATACTQPPAKVDMRGNQAFSNRDSAGSTQMAYNSAQGFYSQPLGGKSPYNPASVYTNTPRFESDETYSSVYVPPVERIDLPPQQQAQQLQQGAPFAQQPSPFAQPQPAPLAQPQEAERVSPWRAPDGDQSMSAPAQAEPESSAVLLYDEKMTPVQQTSSSELAPSAGGSASGFMWPVGSKKVISAFGPKSGGQVNTGINIALAEGEPIWAAADGEVTFVGNEGKSFGNMVILKHSAGKSTTYAHMSRATVDKYDRVKQGDIIGYVGATGSVSQPQLHFAIRDGKEALDPQKILPNKMAGL